MSTAATIFVIIGLLSVVSKLQTLEKMKISFIILVNMNDTYNIYYV